MAYSLPIEDIAISTNFKRIRASAPYRKSITLTDMDLERATKLEKIFDTVYRSEAPFNFSKTISKALEIAFFLQLTPMQQSGSEQ